MNVLTQPFEKGVLSVLHGHWKLVIKTPLMIRAGSEPKAKSAFKQQSQDYKKGRGMEMAFAWKDAAQKKSESPKEWSEVTDFNYHFFVNKDNKLDVEYSIPASSIRGSLRQWAIKDMVKRNDRGLFSIPKREAAESEAIAHHISEVQEEIKTQKKGWHDVLSLFGCTFDLDPYNPLTWAGRMRLNTTIISDKTPQKIEAGGEGIPIADGPQNIRRHINVRNPIDRVTMAAKEGGLHYALEMSEGEKFAVDFHILNPIPTDVCLIKLWTEDIEGGYLRFGGLTSQGRGRIDFYNDGKNMGEKTGEYYRLFVSTQSPLSNKVKEFGRPAKIDDLLFENFWNSVELTRSELLTFSSKIA